MPPMTAAYQPPFHQHVGAMPASPVHPFPIPTPTVSTKTDGTLLIEIILSLFGVFGVGWLMAKETIIGTVLLIASVLIYWPLIILGTIFTLGLGLICLGPLSIAAIILNALLLNKALLRKARFTAAQLSQMNVPPRN